MTRVLMAVSLALAAASASAAAAQPAEDDLPHVARVAYADLDLSRPEGRTVLDKRVKAAAEQVCLPGVSMGFDAFQAFRICCAQALAHARPVVALAIARAQTLT